MKRFLIAAVLLIALAVGGYYAWFTLGWHLPSPDRDDPAVPFAAQGTTYLVQDPETGTYSELVLRGVDLLSSMPGAYATAYAPTADDYLRWLEQIGAMGANAVRVVTIMDDDFYNALYTYNTTHAEPLYLVQGLSVADSAGNGAGDAYDENFLGALVDDAKAAVDVVHGRRDLPPTGLKGSGSYRKDVSTWVAGYLVGTEWFPDTIAYTDHNAARSGAFLGDYFATGADATPFEAALAQVMDVIASYETDKYATQRPVGMLVAPDCDLLVYEDVYARQLQKYAFVDPEHVVPTNKMQAGRFAAYRLFDFCDNFSAYLSQDQAQALAPLLADLDTTQVFGGYLQFLSRYHTMPLVAAGYHASSARSPIRLGVEPLTEQEQGEALAQIAQTLEADGWSGGFISTWQDTWERRSWNTAFATDPTNSYLWHDLQTDGQNYGLMAFAPGEEAVCVLDGDPSEWDDGDEVSVRDGMTLSARYDAECLYLLVTGVDADEKAYIPIDVSEEVGSTASTDPTLSFDRGADFLLCLDGPSNTRLLVQERYDALRENFLYETEGEDPFIEFPSPDSAVFVPVRSALSNPLLVDVLNPDTMLLKRLGTWEAGLLTAGSGDPSSEEYDSLADICFGDGCVEIRIPWLLLNVGNPASMEVHRDYYEHYGVELYPIETLWLGIAREGDGRTIRLKPFAVEGWGSNPSYRERLKASYTVMQQLWGGGEGNGERD